MSHAEIIADILDSTRRLTRYYLHELRDVDPRTRFVVDGVTLNAPLWIVAHLTWAEHALVFGNAEVEDLPYPWMASFAFGSTPLPAEELPDMKEIRSAFDDVHTKALAYIRSLTDADLAEEVTFRELDWTDSRMKILYHVIRHEGSHAGHLGWLCKLHGIKTV